MNSDDILLHIERKDFWKDNSILVNGESVELPQIGNLAYLGKGFDLFPHCSLTPSFPLPCYLPYRRNLQLLYIFSHWSKKAAGVELRVQKWKTEKGKWKKNVSFLPILCCFILKYYDYLHTSTNLMLLLVKSYDKYSSRTILDLFKIRSNIELDPINPFL